MFNIQDAKNKMNDNNIYLCIRFMLYFLITIFSIEQLYSTEGINDILYFNTILLYATPLVVEYFFGVRCYSVEAKFLKTTGFLFSLFMVIVGILGLMGLFKFIVNEDNTIIKGIYIYRVNIVLLIRVCPFLCLINTFLDWMFSLGEEERAFYDYSEELSKYAEELIRSNKYKVLENEKERYEEEFKGKIAEMLNNN